MLWDTVCFGTIYYTYTVNISLKQEGGVFLNVIEVKVKHSNQSSCDNLSIIYLTSLILVMITHLEQIINKTVYCNSALAHLGSPPNCFLFGNKIIKEDYFSFKERLVYN